LFGAVCNQRGQIAVASSIRDCLSQEAGDHCNLPAAKLIFSSSFLFPFLKHMFGMMV
jgi:hypothetical protein